MSARILRTVLSCLASFVAMASVCAPQYAFSAEGSKLPFHQPKNISELPQHAVIETNRGAIRIEFFREQAPIAVRNFEYLVKKNFYNNLTFHRLMPGYLIQGGDPSGNGRGGTGYTLPPEFSSLHHVRGTIGMARNRDEINPERRSNGSQFYVCLTKCAWLDGSYTVFAHVVAGMENVDLLTPGDKILRIYFPGVHT